MPTESTDIVDWVARELTHYRISGCPRRELRKPIKRFFLGLLVAIGLLFAFYALAQSNKPTNTASYFDDSSDYFQNTLINTPGIPDLVGWDKFQALEQERQRANLAAHKGGNCSCVTYAKRLVGFTASVGAARNWPVNSSVCTPGSIVVFTSGSWGHVAQVDTCGPSTGTIRSEANFVSCQVSFGRTFDLSRPDIKGYYIK